MKRNRIIWAFGLGYFAFYVPYSGTVKTITSYGLTGLQILPATVVGTLIAVTAALIALGWWRDGRPVRDRRLLLSGIGTGVIIGTTTIAYTFDGISIVLALLLMRGGVLTIAPLVDLLHRRRVRWFCWAALAFSFAAVFYALTTLDKLALPIAAAVNLAFYLSGYMVRLPMMTRAAKVRDRALTRQYFVDEALVAMATLAIVPIVAALLPLGAASAQLRYGFAHMTLPGLAAGVFYAGLYFFGTLIYLDHRENTFCIPLNRCSSLLAGIVAALIVSYSWNVAAVPRAQFVAAGMMFVALLLLSPFHHKLEDAWAFVRGVPLREATLVTESRLILFVCSGNTCRSPMAAAISNAELALRLGGRNGIRAESAGLTPRGAAMTEASHAALREMSIAAPPHQARPLTAKHVAAAEVIYCMTEGQRHALLRQHPEAAAKTRCLDPAGDIPDPIGHPQEVYSDVARRIQALVRVRFDELGVVAA